MGEAELQQLLDQAKIERLTQLDPETARTEVETARTHIEAAAKIADVDPTLAFTGLYDAMRKSIQAHMRANGFRTTKGPGGHAKTGEYALAALDAAGIEDHLDEFDALRILRNQSEYDGHSIDPEEVMEAAAHAHAIVEAVARSLNID